MKQRRINEKDARHIVAHGVSVPDASPPGAAPRTRSTGFRDGRRITVVIAHEHRRRLVITVF